MIDPTAIPPSFVGALSSSYVGNLSRSLARWRILQISPAYVGNLFIMLLYVCGVVLLIYSLMQLVHGLEAKDKEYTRRGFLFLLISIVLLLTRPLASLLF